MLLKNTEMLVIFSVVGRITAEIEAARIEALAKR